MALVEMTTRITELRDELRQTVDVSQRASLTRVLDSKVEERDRRREWLDREFEELDRDREHISKLLAALTADSGKSPEFIHGIEGRTTLPKRSR